MTMVPDVTTADNLDVDLCTVSGVEHDWRPHEYTRYNHPQVSWRCVWCHAVSCGDYSETDPCMEPYHHVGEHKSRSGVSWPLGGDRPAILEQQVGVR
jgi:hypothetical protein